jgi:quinol monooxygenase YgiN
MKMDMFVALVDFTVAPNQRDTALKVLLKQVEKVTGLEGCQTFRPYCDPGNEDHVGIIHEWQDEASFDRYLNSDGFARLGAELRPMMTSVPSSRRYVVKQQSVYSDCGPFRFPLFMSLPINPIRQDYVVLSDWVFP